MLHSEGIITSAEQREKGRGREISTSPWGGEYDENCLIRCSCWLSVGQEERAGHPGEGIPEKDQTKCLSVIKKNTDNAAHVGHPSQFLRCLLQLVCVYRGIFINTVATQSKYTAE